MQQAGTTLIWKGKSSSYGKKYPTHPPILTKKPQNFSIVWNNFTDFCTWLEILWITALGTQFGWFLYLARNFMNFCTWHGISQISDTSHWIFHWILRISVHGMEIHGFLYMAWNFADFSTCHQISRIYMYVSW